MISLCIRESVLVPIVVFDTVYFEISYHNDIFRPLISRYLITTTFSRYLIRTDRTQTKTLSALSPFAIETTTNTPPRTVLPSKEQNWLAPAGAGGQQELAGASRSWRQQEEKWHMKTPAAPPAARLSESDQAIHREKNRHPSSRDPCDGR